MQIKEEPHFFVNDFLIEAEELKGVLRELTKMPEKYMGRAELLRKFTNEMFRAYRKNRKQFYIKETAEITTEIHEAEKETEELNYYLENRGKLKEQLKKELLEKKEELLKKLQEVEQHNGIIEEQKQITEKQSIPMPEPKISSSQLGTINTAPIQKPETEIKIPILKPTEIKKENKIQDLINNQEIQEIICDGPYQPLKTLINNKEKLSPITLTNEEINNFILETAKKTNAEISENNPFLMAELENLQIQATFGTANTTPKFIVLKK